MPELTANSKTNRSLLILFLEILSLVSIITVIFYLCIQWSVIPNMVPTHFGLSKPDAWGDKSMLIGLAAFAFVLYIIFTSITVFLFVLIRRNIPINNLNSAQVAATLEMLAWMKLETLLTFIYIGYITIQVALDNITGLGISFLPVSLIVVFGTVIYYAIRILKLK